MVRIVVDLEKMFLNHFSITKKPDIFELIKAAVGVAEWKYPTEFKNYKDDLLKLLMNSGKPEDEDEEEEEEDEYDVADSFAEFGDQREAIVQETSPRFQENNNSTLTTDKHSFKKTNIDVDTQGKNMNTTVTTMSNNRSGDSREIKGSMETHKGAEEFGEQLKQEGTKQLHRQQGDKKMNTVAVTSKNCTGNLRKTETDMVQRKRLDNGGDQQGTKHSSHITQSNNRTTITRVNMGSAAKQCRRGVSGNAAIKRVQVDPHHGKQFTDDGSRRLHQGKELQKQSNTAKTTEDIKDLKKRSSMDFESSKRKFEERFAEQSRAKRRIIMVDFHDMPKTARDPCAAPKRCWDRRRF